MKITSYLLILILFFMLISCEKTIDDVAFTSYQLQIVKKGSHYHDDHSVIDLTTFSTSVFSVSVKLDTSLLVTNEGGYQSKLVGFCEDQIHNNSARVSYQTTTHEVNGEFVDSLILKTYIYNSGVRMVDANYTLLSLSRKQMEEMLKKDQATEISIGISNSNYLYRINGGEIVEVPRTCELPLDANKYLAYLYYGGPDSIPAPHDMKLWIKYNESMR